MENATITDVFVGREDHGILTLWLQLQGDGWGVGYGGYSLDQWDEQEGRRVGSSLLADLILALFDTFEVDSLDKLKGKPCRYDGEHADKFGSSGARLGHFTKNRWVDFKVLAQQAREKEKV